MPYLPFRTDAIHQSALLVVAYAAMTAWILLSLLRNGSNTGDIEAQVHPMNDILSFIQGIQVGRPIGVKATAKSIAVCVCVGCIDSKCDGRQHAPRAVHTWRGDDRSTDTYAIPSHRRIVSSVGSVIGYGVFLYPLSCIVGGMFSALFFHLFDPQGRDWIVCGYWTAGVALVPPVMVLALLSIVSCASNDSIEVSKSVDSVTNSIHHRELVSGWCTLVVCRDCHWT